MGEADERSQGAAATAQRFADEIRQSLQSFETEFLFSIVTKWGKNSPVSCVEWISSGHPKFLGRQVPNFN
jgi:hypothetical protein